MQSRPRGDGKQISKSSSCGINEIYWFIQYINVYIIYCIIFSQEKKKSKQAKLPKPLQDSKDGKESVTSWRELVLPVKHSNPLTRQYFHLIL